MDRRIWLCAAVLLVAFILLTGCVPAPAETTFPICCASRSKSLIRRRRSAHRSPASAGGDWPTSCDRRWSVSADFSSAT